MIRGRRKRRRRGRRKKERRNHFVLVICPDEGQMTGGFPVCTQSIQETPPGG